MESGMSWLLSRHPANSRLHHSSSHMNQFKVSYTCSFCDKIFNHKYNFLKHERTHTGEKPYECPTCPYRASRTDLLKLHMNKHNHYVSENQQEPSYKNYLTM